MVIALPLAVGNRLVGTTVLVHHEGNKLFFASCLHLVGEGGSIQVVNPPHGGNCSAVQSYPIESAPTLEATVVAADPLTDLALLAAEVAGSQLPRPPQIAQISGTIPVGSEAVVLGYPFAPIGSMLETWTPCFVTALAKRHLSQDVGVDELVLSAQAHPGSSGSAVVGKADGVIHGILRGSLSPPDIIRVGDIPIATDTSVTFASSAHILLELISKASI